MAVVVVVVDASVAPQRSGFFSFWVLVSDTPVLHILWRGPIHHFFFKNLRPYFSVGPGWPEPNLPCLEDTFVVPKPEGQWRRESEQHGFESLRAEGQTTNCLAKEEEKGTSLGCPRK